MGVIFENGGENRAFPKNWADIGLFLKTGPKKTGILENGAKNRAFLKTEPKNGKRAGTQRRGLRKNRTRRWVFMKMVIKNSWPGKGGLRK